MAFSRVLWLSFRKRVRSHAAWLMVCLAAVVGTSSVLTQWPSVRDIAYFFVLGAGLYHAHVLGALLGALYGLQVEVRRKLVHLVGGGGLICAALISASTALVVALSALLLLWMLATRYLSQLKLLRQLSVDRRDGSRSWGDVLFPVGIAMSALAATVDSPAWLAGASVLVIADTAAALVGASYGRLRYATWGGRKSIEGSIAFFVCAILVLLGVTQMYAMPLGISHLIAAGALLTAVEAVAAWGSDNLLLPLAALLVLESGLPIDAAALLLPAAAIVVVLLLKNYRATYLGRA